jgi:hypothetical protein
LFNSDLLKDLSLGKMKFFALKFGSDVADTCPMVQRVRAGSGMIGLW